MILGEFPFRDASPSNRRDSPPFGAANVVVRASADAIEYGWHRAPLSIKTVERGEEHYDWGRGWRRVTPATMLILNRETGYRSRIDTSEPTRSLCVFFADDMAAHAAATTWNEALDADPGKSTCASPPDGLAPLGGAMRRTLARLAMDLRDPVDLDAWCADVLAQLMNAAALTPETADRPRREEVRRRLRRAQDLALSEFDRPVSVTELAAEAGLSRFHFIRLFRAWTGTTPARFLRDARLSEARRLLTETTLAVSEIALAVGYSDFSAFSRAYRAVHGCSPGRSRA